MITHISPLGSMDLLSQLEVDMLKRTASSDLYRLFRNCSLAVLNSGSQTDNSKQLLSRYETFDINVLRRERGVKLELVNPPEEAFVDGRIIRSLQANLFAVLRDILFVHGQIASAGRFQHLNLENSAHITNLVFSILRNARTLHLDEDPNMVVCWGGHSINENEYLYARKVGSQLGLRELNICTGCGPGAMEAPMKGAAVGHAQQRYRNSRFIGMTEPSIIAAEPPNPLVNELVIMPDIEKRAVRQIALPGSGGDHQRVMLTIKLPGLQRALFEQFDLMALLAEDVLRLFRHQQRIAVDRSHEDTNLSHGSNSLHYL